MAAVLALTNPHAQGGRLRRLAPALAQAVALRAPQAQWALPEMVAEALHLIHQLPPGSRVLAFGGDGTVNRWLPALLAGGHTLALVPMGSGNDLARALGLYGLPWTEALEYALTSSETLIDVGEVVLRERPDAGPPDPLLPASSAAQATRTVPFLSSLAVGFDASVGLRALRGPRWLRGQPRYLWATFKELAALRNWGLRIAVDGSPAWQGRVLLASTLNTRSYGSGMPAAPSARIDDGRMELLRAAAMGRPGVLTLLPRLLRGTHLSDTRVSLQPFQTLEVQSAEPVPLAVDGEYLGEFTRFEVRVLPAALRVVRAPSAG
jgi:diacylglycerol kinase family enzyme